MTTSLHNPARLSRLPASQNTAPVAEFRCLFTHDIRRKQKRWQDGYLKFHSFNSRVMLYDTSRNYVGDTYWKDANSPQEGDELTLDKGVMVEVADAVGVSQTDLTPLFEKSSKPPHGEPAPATRKPQGSNPPNTSSHLRHKSLSTLLGNPRGPIGKATPIKSPYEIRRERKKENESAGNRTAKRQKTTHNPVRLQTGSSSPIVNLTSNTKNHSVYPPRALNQTSSAAGGAVPRGSTPIVLDSTSSDVPFSSPDIKPHAADIQTLPNTSVPPQSLMRNGVSTEKTPRIPKGRIRLPHARPVETPQPPLRSSSPPVSASNRVSNVDFALQPIKKRQKDPSPKSSPQRDPRAKSLRLSRGVKRRMLLCELSPPSNRAPPKPIETIHSKAKGAKPSDGKQTGYRPKVLGISETNVEAAHASSDDDELMPTNATLCRISLGSPHQDDQSFDKREKSASRKHESVGESSPSLLSLSPAFEDIDVVRGLMEQKMLPKVSPKRQHSARVKSLPGPSPRLEERNKVDEEGPNEYVSQKLANRRTARSASKPKRSQAKPETPCRPTANTLESGPQDPGQVRETITIPDDSPTSEPSPPPSSLEQPSTAQVPRAAPAAQTRPSHSPTKSKPAAPFSTGGIRTKHKKKDGNAVPNRRKAKIDAKRPQRDQERPTPLHRESDSPTDPLFAGGKIATGPMNPGAQANSSCTTGQMEEGNAAGNIINPIGSRSVAIGKSPLRRVKSANNANMPDTRPNPPIRSTSEDWERRNMAMPPPPLLPGEGSAVVEKQDVPQQQTCKPEKSGLAALIKRTDPRRKLLRTTGLDVDTAVGGEGSVADMELPSPVVDNDVGPWSTEAFDLLGWKPEGR
ncbi:uncharacterized protein EI97DRAFT_281671 [Westerdykella ornata]|uniref:5'-3' DNA helicase ZGRF1-like N-terminal domain-containing protein n=1 Tax=Westerdykella ornata TaxID=318751 RepID=A0A6A6JND0_WESOR|nr:uncharacterized protein EI97DRAFT_281671 [Westerdykella ornata]KAF2278022.1 hypothetical protein EI97DRAFT_281671 [Westerdykella ornata]